MERSAGMQYELMHIRRRWNPHLRRCFIPASVVINALYKQIIMTRSIPFSLAVPAVPVARDEMDEAAFNVMMAHGMNEAKADKSRAASDVFADLRR